MRNAIAEAEAKAYAKEKEDAENKRLAVFALIVTAILAAVSIYTTSCQKKVMKSTHNLHKGMAEMCLVEATNGK